MTKKKLDYKDKLILVYFNSLKRNYNPAEIILLLKINYEHFYERMSFLIDEEYIIEGQFVLEISKKGKDYLYSKFLNNVEFTDLTMENVEVVDKSLKTNEIIYIPKNFDKKI